MVKKDYFTTDGPHKADIPPRVDRAIYSVDYHFGIQKKEIPS